MTDNVNTPFSRTWMIENRAGPGHVPSYIGRGRAKAFTWSLGDRTPVREPSSSRYGAFDIVDGIKAERELPKFSFESRYQFTKSEILRIARIGCPVDLQVHMGKCQNPSDFNGGWSKILAFDGADFSQYSTEELGAITQGQNNPVLEMADLNSLDAYEILPLVAGQLGEAQIVQEVVAVTICDSITCGTCGISSDGCSHIFALQKSAGASPGLSAELIWSINGGATLNEISITTLPAASNPSAMRCIGSDLVIASNADCSLHYASIASIFAGTQVWTRTATGLVCAAGAPNAIFSAGFGFSWVVGAGGYIYKITDITTGVVVQDAGVATVQNLLDVDGADELNIVAVGASNAVVYTRNGGSIWASVTGPAVGVALNAVWVKSQLEWFVGTAGGKLFFTNNGGITWTEIAFPGSGSGVVYDIAFNTDTVGVMSHSTSGLVARLLRTIDGGRTWYVLPEGTGSIPSSSQLNSIAACIDDPNIVYAGGLEVAGGDGMLIKAAG